MREEGSGPRGKLGGMCGISTGWSKRQEKNTEAHLGLCNLAGLNP